MTKHRMISSDKISLIIMALLLFIPTLTYCLSQAAKDLLFLDNTYTLIAEPIKECLIPSNPYDSILNSIEKDNFSTTKVLWMAYILDNQIQTIHSNLQIKATENNLEPPKDLKLFLVSHYLNRSSDLFL